jgi:glycosyltransferase involved in cell wall biosynthesis
MSHSEVAVVIITKNEEAVIGQCLDRLKDWTQDIVVVDSFSTDRTVEICERYGCRVFQRTWPGSFADQKNFAIRQARSDWVFIVDADELIEPALREEVLTATRAQAKNQSLVGFQIPTRNFFINKYSHYAWAPDYHVRLFRNGCGIAYDLNSVVHEKLKYDDTLLENVRSNGNLTLRLKSPILHYSNTTFTQIFMKQNLYTSLEVEKLALLGRGGSLIWRFFRPSLCFFYYYVIKKGFLDGVNGLMISLVMFNYELGVFLKLWEYKSGQLRAGAHDRPRRWSRMHRGAGLPSGRIER